VNRHRYADRFAALDERAGHFLRTVAWFGRHTRPEQASAQPASDPRRGGVHLASKNRPFPGVFSATQPHKGNRIIETYGAGDGNRTEHPLNSAMISADFTESRNSPSSHGKWLGSLQRRTATFCRLNNAASTIPTMKCVGWDVG